MNNKELITELSNKSKLSTREVTTYVNNIVSIITDELMEENTVSIGGFGNFEVKKKLERVVVNPVSKQRMLVPPKMVVSFKPFNTLKDKANSK